MALDPFAAAEIGPGRMRSRLRKAARIAGMAVGGLVAGRLSEFHRAGSAVFPVDLVLPMVMRDRLWLLAAEIRRQLASE